MSSVADVKRNLRERSEGALRRAVLSELGRDQPGTVEPYRPKGDRFWRMLFVPLYRRLPWSVKERAMGLLGMTAKGWQPPARKPGEPWRPPAGVAPAPPPATASPKAVDSPEPPAAA
jgi:hypothetical protein